MIKQNIFEVLMYLVENYVDQEIEENTERVEIEIELLQAGFGDLEVNLAFNWLDQLSDHPAMFDPRTDSLRIYRDEERKRLGIEGIGFLHQLEQNSLLKPVAREQVIEQFMALNSHQNDISQLKWVVLMVLMNHPNNDATNFTWFEELVYDERPMNIH